MGSLFQPKQPAPLPPAPPSERAGSDEKEQQGEYNPFTGRRTKVIPIPQPPSERDELLNNAVQESLNEVSKLSLKEYKADKQTRQILKEWANRQDELLNEYERKKFMRWFQGE